MSPAIAATGERAVAKAAASPELRERLHSAASRFRGGLGDLGIAPRGFGPIIPWVIGAPERAMSIAAALRERGVHVQAIRPPSVATGTARIRFTVTARHTAEDVDAALAALAEVVACFGP